MFIELYELLNHNILRGVFYMNEKMIDLIDGSVICFCFTVIMPSSVVLESFDSNRNFVLLF